MRLPLAVEEFLPRPTGNYPDCLRPFQSPFRLKFQAALSRYALSQGGTEVSAVEIEIDLFFLLAGLLSVH